MEIAFRQNGENMDILNEAKKNFDYMVRIRRHMHEYPENSGVEYETVKYIASELDALGIEYVVVPEVRPYRHGEERFFPVFRRGSVR